jgi:hypothetical protein
MISTYDSRVDNVPEIVEDFMYIDCDMTDEEESELHLQGCV